MAHLAPVLSHASRPWMSHLPGAGPEGWAAVAALWVSASLGRPPVLHRHRCHCCSSQAPASGSRVLAGGLLQSFHGMSCLSRQCRTLSSGVLQIAAPTR